jgi:universal stress protein E
LIPAKDFLTTSKENQMKRFKNISLIYECDQSTLDRAALLAQENEAQLTLVQVIKSLPDAWNHVTVGDKQLDVKKLMVEELEEQLNKAASSVLPIGVRPQTRLLEGEPYLEIIRDVIENDRDLVIVTPTQQTSIMEYFFGNTVSRLIRDCPCPILALKPSKEKGFKKILVAVDPVLVGDSHDTLNRVILELATSLSELEDAELHVVYAWRLVGESMMRGRFLVPEADINLAIHAESERCRKLVETMLKKHSVAQHQLHLIKGEASAVIPELVKDLEIDLLLMGTVCRTGIPGFVIGNTAEKVLAAVECSTLTVKPEGFVSPITPQIARY